jgi:hypothetical protein
VCHILRTFPTFLDSCWGYAGVSAGSICAATLANGIDVLEMQREQLFKTFVRQVFVQQRMLLTRLGKAKIESNALRDFALTLFPESFKMMKERLLIVSTNVDNKKEGIERSAEAAYHHNFGDKVFFFSFFFFYYSFFSLF